MKREMYAETSHNKMSRSQVRTIFAPHTPAQKNISRLHIDKLASPNELYSSQVHQGYQMMSPQEGRLPVRGKMFNFPVHISYSNPPTSSQTTSVYGQSSHNDTSTTMTNLHSKMENTRSEIMMLSEKISQMKKETTRLEPLRRMENNVQLHVNSQASQIKCLEGKNLSASFHENRQEQNMVNSPRDIRNNYSPRLDYIQEQGAQKQSNKNIYLHRSRDDIQSTQQLKSSKLSIYEERKLLQNDYEQLQKSRQKLEKQKWKLEMEKSENNLQTIKISSLKQRNTSLEAQAEDKQQIINNLRAQLNAKQLKIIQGQLLLTQIRSENKNIQNVIHLTEDQRQENQKMKQKLQAEIKQLQRRVREYDFKEKKLEDEKKQTEGKIKELHLIEIQFNQRLREQQQKERELLFCEQNYKSTIDQEAYHRQQCEQQRQALSGEINFLKSEQSRLKSENKIISVQQHRIKDSLQFSKQEYSNFLQLKKNIENDVNIQKQQISQQINFLRSLENQKQQLILAIEQVQLQKQSIKTNYLSDESDMVNKQEMKNQMMRDLEAIHRQLQMLAREKQESHRIVLQQRGEQTLIQAQIEAAASSLQELQAHKHYIEEQLNNNKRSLQNIIHQRNSILEENQNVQKSVMSRNQQLRELNYQREQMAAEIITLASDINTLNSERVSIHEELRNNNKTSSSSPNVLQQIEKQLSECKNSQNILEDENNKLVNQISAGNLQLVQISKENIGLVEQVQFLKSNLAIENEKNLKLNAEGEQNKKKILKIQQNKQIQKRIETIQSQNVQMRNKITFLERDITHKTAQINKVKVAISRSEDQIKKLIQNLNKVMLELKNTYLKSSQLESSLARITKDKEYLVKTFTNTISDFMALLLKVHELNSADFSLMKVYKKQLHSRNIQLPYQNKQNRWRGTLLEILEESVLKRLDFQIKMNEEIMQQKIEDVFHKITKCSNQLNTVKQIKH